MDNVPVHKSELGIVFQYYALFPHLTVLDNVTFPLIRRRMPNAKAKELYADENQASAGQPAIRTHVRQAIYLGSGWKFEIVLPDGEVGVVLSWNPSLIPSLPA